MAVTTTELPSGLIRYTCGDGTSFTGHRAKERAAAHEGTPVPDASGSLPPKPKPKPAKKRATKKRATKKKKPTDK